MHQTHWCYKSEMKQKLLKHSAVFVRWKVTVLRCCDCFCHHSCCFVCWVFTAFSLFKISTWFLFLFIAFCLLLFLLCISVKEEFGLRPLCIVFYRAAALMIFTAGFPISHCGSTFLPPVLYFEIESLIQIPDWSPDIL